MSLNFGRTQTAIPGPSVVPDRVLNAMHRPSPDIYSPELERIVISLEPDLKAVAQTKHNVATYIANGHGVWEAALRNIVKTGEHVLVLGTGRFAQGWAVMAQSLGIEVTLLEFGMQSPADPQKLEEALREDTSGKFKAVLMVQTDTASSVLNDVKACRDAINAAQHDALFVVDCIACLGCDRFEMDNWGVDITITACQKGLMTPAGLGFVYFNDKALEVSKNTSPGEYWDWYPRVNPDIFYKRYDGTAPTHHLYALREALNILVHEEGIENAWSRHTTIANSIWAAIEKWNVEGSMQHNIQDKSLRSTAVSTITMQDGNATKLRKWVEQNAGVTLGVSLGFPEEETDNSFRIGHMGHQNIPMVLGVLGSIDTGLKALKIPHAEGALAAATSILAKH